MSKVSVVMPNYNKAEYIYDAVYSVLMQDFDFELVLVDNCSTDESLNIVRQFNDPRVRILINEENRGIVYSRNKGTESAETDYILTMDSDDILAPGTLARMSSVLDSDLSLGITYAHFAMSNGSTVTCEEWDVDNLMVRNRIPICAMFRKQAWKEVGGYDPNFASAEDWDLWIAMASIGYKGKLCNMVGSWYRLSTSNSSINQLKDPNVPMEQSKFYALCQRLCAKYPYYELNKITPESLYRSAF